MDKVFNYADWQINRVLLTLRLHDLTADVSNLSYDAWWKCVNPDNPLLSSQTGYCIYNLEDDPDKEECVVCGKPFNRENKG